MIPAASTLLQQFTRLRPTGAYDGTGRWTPGPDDETVMFGSIQPDSTDDYPTEGGRQYRQRLKIYVAPLAVQATTPSALQWGADTLTWGGSALTWGAAGGLVETEPSLRAGDETVGPDRVRLADERVFIVDRSESWSSHTEAELLREP